MSTKIISFVASVLKERKLHTVKRSDGLGGGCFTLNGQREEVTLSCAKKFLSFSGGSDGKAPAYNAGDPGSNAGLGRSPGEGNGNPLRYSCLENPMDRGACWTTVHGVVKCRTRLTDFTKKELNNRSSRR